MPKARTSMRSRKERTGIDRLYKYVGARKVSFYYQHRDGRSETLASAVLGDRQAIDKAAIIAKRRALEIQQGMVSAGSVAEMIEKFKDETAPEHYRDQSKEALENRALIYRNLIKFFGAMAPLSLRTRHGYQYLEARAKSGAPARANKELSLMSTICHFGIRWGLMEKNPFVGMLRNKTDTVVRTTSRSQILRFYLWSLRQPAAFRNMGCAAMFTYLTGFRAAEVRPFHMSGLSDAGVRVLAAKRKKGQKQVVKLREWSTRLRVVVARAKQTHKAQRMYLFANQIGKPYTRSGWGSTWTDAMFEWIASFDDAVATALASKRAWESQYRAARKEGRTIAEYSGYLVTEHPQYFSALDIRPAAITTKLRNKDADAYDFAAHSNPATTHQHYDRRSEKKARATE